MRNACENAETLRTIESEQRKTRVIRCKADGMRMKKDTRLVKFKGTRLEKLPPEFGVMQKRVNLVDLKNPEKMRLLSLSELSIQKRTSLLKFGGQNFIISIDSLIWTPGSQPAS